MTGGRSIRVGTVAENRWVGGVKGGFAPHEAHGVSMWGNPGFLIFPDCSARSLYLLLELTLKSLAELRLWRFPTIFSVFLVSLFEVRSITQTEACCLALELMPHIYSLILCLPPCLHLQNR